MSVIFFEVLKICAVIFGIIISVIVMLGLLYLVVTCVDGISDRFAAKRTEKLRSKYPEYYEKQDLYDSKVADTARFQFLEIEEKKMQINALLEEIKYLPKAHIVAQEEKIEQLKMEIYENTHRHKTMVEENARLLQELKLMKANLK